MPQRAYGALSMTSLIDLVTLTLELLTHKNQQQYARPIRSFQLDIYGTAPGTKQRVTLQSANVNCMESRFFQIGQYVHLK